VGRFGRVTGNAFLPGRRIRVEPSSSGFPPLCRSPNTGHPYDAEAELSEATQVAYYIIFRDAKHVSHVVLPVIP